MKIKPHIVSLLIVLIVGIVGMKALFHSGLFTAHDIWHQVARLYWYNQSIKGGIFPPLWITPLANGFGYPLFVFSYTLPWIIAIPFLRGGVEVITVIKLLFIFSFVASGFSMYWLIYEIFKKKIPALVSAILYTWVPYHFLQILVSAAMGRAFVFTFTPILFLGVYFLGKSETKNKGVFIFSIAFLCLALSHLMSFLAIFPALFLFMLWVKPRLLDVLRATLLSLGLASFYLIPSVIYSSFTQVKTGSFSLIYEHNFISFKQLLYSRWGYAPIEHDAREGAISFQLGFAQWFGLFLTTLLIVFLSRRKNKKLLFPASFIAVSSVVSIFLMLQVSKPLWELGSKVITLDYPTMFMMPLVFVTTFSVAFVLSLIKPKILVILTSFFVILLCLVNNRNHLRVNMYTDFPLQSYVDSEVTTNSYNEYLPTYVSHKVLNTPKEEFVFEKGVEVLSHEQTVNSLKLKINNPTDQVVTFRQFAFPGVTLYVNGKREDYTSSDKKLVSKYLLKGEYEIGIKYEKTPLMKVSVVISLLSFAYLLFVLKRIYFKK